jgi:CheY-like chemotaxis protein
MPMSDTPTEPRPLRILLVEDSDSNRLLIQSHLKALPCRLDTAENGLVAVDMYQAVRYDLVLMDTEMPEMDGHAATREIRRYEQESGLPETPIIALTAHERKEAEHRSLAAGCTVHLIKPITKSALLRTIYAHAAAAPALQRPLRILFADDSVSSRVFVQSYFKGTPHRLDTAENGLVAVDMYQAVRYDLVLMDMEMPEMDGYEATRRIRALEGEQVLSVASLVLSSEETQHSRLKTQNSSRVPIIALTAHTSKEEQARTLDAGCTAHLTKPFEKAVLFALIWEQTVPAPPAPRPLPSSH